MNIMLIGLRKYEYYNFYTILYTNTTKRACPHVICMYSHDIDVYYVCGYRPVLYMLKNYMIGMTIGCGCQSLVMVVIVIVLDVG